MRVSSKKTTQNSFKSYRLRLDDDSRFRSATTNPKLYPKVYDAEKLRD